MNNEYTTQIKQLQLRLDQADARALSFQERFLLLEDQARKQELQHSEQLNQNKLARDEHNRALEAKLKGIIDDAIAEHHKPLQKHLAHAISSELSRSDALSSLQKQLDKHRHTQQIVI